VHWQVRAPFLTNQPMYTRMRSCSIQPSLLVTYSVQLLCYLSSLLRRYWRVGLLRKATGDCVEEWSLSRASSDCPQPCLQLGLRACHKTECDPDSFLSRADLQCSEPEHRRIRRLHNSTPRHRTGTRHILDSTGCNGSCGRARNNPVRAQLGHRLRKMTSGSKDREGTGNDSSPPWKHNRPSSLCPIVYVASRWLRQKKVMYHSQCCFSIGSLPDRGARGQGQRQGVLPGIV